MRWGGLCSDLGSVWSLSCSILLLHPTYLGLTLTVKLSSSAQGLPSGAWQVKCTSIYNAEIRAQGDRAVCIHGKHQLCSTLCSIMAPNFLPVLILVNKFPPSRPGRITVRTDCSWVRIQPESRKEQANNHGVRRRNGALFIKNSFLTGHRSSSCSRLSAKKRSGNMHPILACHCDR